MGISKAFINSDLYQSWYMVYTMIGIWFINHVDLFQLVCSKLNHRLICIFPWRQCIKTVHHNCL